jgi:hypothetical protein
MLNERRKYPRIALNGQAHLLIAGVTFDAKLLNLSPSGIQIECGKQVVEQLAGSKTHDGLYPDFEFEFALPMDGSDGIVNSICNVAYQREQQGGIYLLGLNFIGLSNRNETMLGGHLKKSDAA